MFDGCGVRTVAARLLDRCVPNPTRNQIPTALSAHPQQLRADKVAVCGAYVLHLAKLWIILAMLH
jgi:hypothetical protein